MQWYEAAGSQVLRAYGWLRDSAVLQLCCEEAASHTPALRAVPGVPVMQQGLKAWVAKSWVLMAAG
jgi:hypothetical protein